MDIKNKIIELLKGNHQSGFFTEEISDLLEIPIDIIRKCLKDNDCFYYDNNCESYTGWRNKE